MTLLLNWLIASAPTLTLMAASALAVLAWRFAVERDRSRGLCDKWAGWCQDWIAKWEQAATPKGSPPPMPVTRHSPELAELVQETTLPIVRALRQMQRDQQSRSAVGSDNSAEACTPPQKWRVVAGGRHSLFFSLRDAQTAVDALRANGVATTCEGPL